MGAVLSDLHPYTTDRNRFLTDSGRDYSTIHSWSWADPEGTVIASSDPKAIGLKIGDRDYFRELRGGRPWTLSNLLTDRISGVPIFIIASRVDDPKGSLVGVVVAVADVGDLGQRAVELYHPVGEAIALFDRNGVLVYRSQKTPDLFHDKRRDDPLLAAALKSGTQQSGVVTLAWKARQTQNCIAARIPIRDIGWVAGAVAGGQGDGRRLHQFVDRRRPDSAGRPRFGGSGVYDQRQPDPPTAAAAIARRSDRTRRVRTRCRSRRRPRVGRVGDGLQPDGNHGPRGREALEATNAALEQRVRERTAELATTIVRFDGRSGNSIHSSISAACSKPASIRCHH